ncbi:MAG TPA: histidine phosphatase family protein [Thermogutta sp.]|mgnify:CR=1 FL=1|nr:histidine phosphatase family protein [Thermogutta sp.]HOP77935.1 histidine phosphatase family protein [Thermogutta sp.]HPU06358.1 histidine phosphatase family protein [Thermogutta sp.]HPZ83703.1 histidine phosphatase family protein [Thermogutta sp.]HQF13694.1 histidine phosphatase family protein [Thermogutta sp.]
MLIYCIRHGESTYNSEGRVQGQSDVPLSDLGRRQGEATAEALAKVGLEIIYSSPLRRAYETAEMVARRTGCDIRIDPRLMEIHAGIFQDRLRHELIREFPEDFRRWTSEDPDFVIPGGESRRQLAERGVAAFRDIAQSKFERVAVVSHGRLLVVTLKALLVDSSHLIPPALQNASITVVEADPKTGQFRLVDVDQTDHLIGVGLSGRGDL